jgi:uncharacterized protein
MTHYLYLHGFASGPQSYKAQALKTRFEQLGIPLQIPDLNQGDFSHLTLSRQIQQVQDLILAQPEPTVLIGSSLGGLTATWVAEQPELQGRLEKLILLAPAFEFLDQWLPRLGPDQLDHWRSEGSLPIYHYGQQQTLPLHYDFVKDARRYPDTALKAEIPTLLIHGLYDEVIAIAASRTYAATRPWVTLVALPSDHTLGDGEAVIWQQTQEFLGLSAGPGSQGT